MIRFFFFQAEDGIRDVAVTGVQTCALPISQIGVDLDPLARSTGGRLSLTQERGRLAATMELQLVQDVVDVVLDGGDADHQLARDLLVREAAVDEPDNFRLATRQLGGYEPDHPPPR